MLGRLEAVRDLHGASAAHNHFDVVKGVDVYLLDARLINPFLQKGDTCHVLIQAVTQFLRGHALHAVGAAYDILENKFPKQLSCLLLIALRGKLVRVLFRTVFLYVLQNLVVGQGLGSSGGKEHII